MIVTFDVSVIEPILLPDQEERCHIGERGLLSSLPSFLYFILLPLQIYVSLLVLKIIKLKTVFILDR